MTFTSADANMTDSATALVFKKRERERICVWEKQSYPILLLSYFNIAPLSSSESTAWLYGP